MKLIRAICRCGFFSNKARCGTETTRWFFATYDADAAALGDRSVDLADEIHKELNDDTLRRVRAIPSENREERRKMLDKVGAEHNRIIGDFFEQVVREFRQQHAESLLVGFVDDADLVAARLSCPQCKQQTLRVEPVRVMAHCKTDCGHYYQWHDSQQAGCPRCGHRPHYFETETEELYRNLPQVSCFCDCSSRIVCRDYEDCLCPKCSGHPDNYYIGDILDGLHYCGLHHEKMLHYTISAAARSAIFFSPPRGHDLRFPYAKDFPAPRPGEEAAQATYCPACERLRLKEKKENAKGERHQAEQ